MNERQRAEARGLPLPDYFERIHAPTFLDGARPGTMKRNRESLRHWRWATDDPPLVEIDSETLAGFKSRLFDPGRKTMAQERRATQRLLFETEPPTPVPTRPLARETVNLHLRQIVTILTKAGPPGPKNRDALGILDGVTPWTRPLKVYRRRPRNVKDDTLSAIYRAAATAMHPQIDGVSAEHWWKALIVVAVTVGYRKGALLSLRWTDVDWEEQTIRVEAEADKCWTEREKPVTTLVLQHLMRIRGSGMLVFGWPGCESTFYRQWRLIQDAAGIAVTKRIKLHDLKRACGARFARVASPWAVQQRLDHASIATSRFYVNATDEQREAVERMPVPAAFSEDFGGRLPQVSG